MGKGTTSAMLTQLSQNGLPSSVGRPSVTPQYGSGSPYPGVSSTPINQQTSYTPRPVNQQTPYTPSMGLGALNIPASNVTNFFAQQRFQPPQAPIYQQPPMYPQPIQPPMYPRLPVYQPPRSPYVRMPDYVPPPYSFRPIPNPGIFPPPIPNPGIFPPPPLPTPEPTPQPIDDGSNGSDSGSNGD